MAHEQKSRCLSFGIDSTVRIQIISFPSIKLLTHDFVAIFESRQMDWLDFVVWLGLFLRIPSGTDANLGVPRLVDG